MVSSMVNTTSPKRRKPVMSTSLLYHGFGVVGYKYVNTRYDKGAVIFTLNVNPLHLRCSACGSRKLMRRGTVDRCFHSLPIGRKAVKLELPVQRVYCLSCGLLRQAKLGFAKPRRSYTKAFERYALELSKCMTIKDTARHLGVGWDVIKDIQKRYLKKRFSKPRLRHLSHIAIDEISIGKGHRYLTVVLNLYSGAVVFVGKGKGADALVPFWKRLRSSRAKIKAVAIDMSPAYIKALKSNLRKSAIVFDHFHIIKLFNEKLSKLRRKLYHDIKDTQGKRVIKGTRWLLLKNPENLDPARNEAQRLQQALEFNKPLAAAYYMKEELRQLWKQADKERAEAFLNSWIARAKASGCSMLKRFAKTLIKHKEGILAYYDYRISTGPLEGTNNKIKTLQKQAYGYRDSEFFTLKIMALHETKYALVG